MSSSHPPKYIGYHQEDHTTSYSKFYNETIAPIPVHVKDALAQSPYPAGSSSPLSQVADMLNDGYSELETGYTLEPDGSARLAILTVMPKVTPAMWDWWFGWHGSHANRYKLWHPKAHQSAQWKDGKENVLAYISRTSMIEEYIGSNLEKASIQFVSPVELGFPSSVINNKDTVFICARVGYTHFPLDFGWLVHQVRITEGGAEMRSRFWLGGRHIQIRVEGSLPRLLSKVLQKVRVVQKQQAMDLLVHCSEEMNHLTAFLPQLYAEFNT